MRTLALMVVVLGLASLCLGGDGFVAGLKVGSTMDMDRLDGKVRQIVGKNHMLVGIENRVTGDSKYRTLVMIKCATDGIVDGAYIGNRGGTWKEVIGSSTAKVTKTVSYKTVLGGSKTVFLLEPVVE